MTRVRWEPRPGAAYAVAFVMRGGPIMIGTLAGWVAAQLLPRPTGMGWVPWTAALAATSNIVVRVADRYARRLLPLSMLLRFSLEFPDLAPSRFAVSLRAGSIERLRKAADHPDTVGLPTNVGEAAATALAMVTSLNRHDRGTRGHSERVRAYAEMLAEEMGLDQAFRDRLRWGALLHDMGKLNVPAEILNKPGRPTDDEWAVLQRHPADGARILLPLADWLGDAVHAAGQHHERWDGAGYPNGFAGEDISLSARIVAVADAFAVMTAARAYKKPLPMAVARQELTKNAGTQFDPAVVRAMLSVSVGRVSRAAGPLSSVGIAPIVNSLLSAAPAVPSMLGSGAAAVALTIGFSTPGSPVEWSPAVPAVAEISATTIAPPTALALHSVVATPAADRPEAPLTFDGPGVSLTGSPVLAASVGPATTRSTLNPNSTTTNVLPAGPPERTEMFGPSSVTPGSTPDEDHATNSVRPTGPSGPFAPPSATTVTPTTPPTTPPTIPDGKAPVPGSTTSTTLSPSAETVPPTTSGSGPKPTKEPPPTTTTAPSVDTTPPIIVITVPSADTKPPPTTIDAPTTTSGPVKPAVTFPPPVTFPPVTVDQ